MFERTCKRVGCGKMKTVPRACKVLQPGSSLSSGTSERRDQRALRLHLMYMYISFAYLFTYAAITYFRLPGFCNIALLFLMGWKKLRLFFFFSETTSIFKGSWSCRDAFALEFWLQGQYHLEKLAYFPKPISWRDTKNNKRIKGMIQNFLHLS